MWVGVWTPTAMPFELERSFFLDWVRLADQAGFDTLSSLDRPNYDMWDPLASLAAAAAVTQRIRPATTTLPLPSWGTENEESPSFRAPAFTNPPPFQHHVLTFALLQHRLIARPVWPTTMTTCHGALACAAPHLGCATSIMQ
jgi:hypothetical protein